jgi:hypothetical protein
MAAKARWKEFLDTVDGREIVTADEFAITQMQLAALAANPDLAKLLATGYSECSIFWVDEDTGVYCKARPDHVHPVTSAREAAGPEEHGRRVAAAASVAAARMGYHRQAAHYRPASKAATGMKVQEFVIGAVTSATCTRRAVHPARRLAEQARDERRELLELYARCQKEERWPAYGSGYQLLQFPAYALRSSEVDVSWAPETEAA